MFGPAHDPHLGCRRPIAATSADRPARFMVRHGNPRVARRRFAVASGMGGKRRRRASGSNCWLKEKTPQCRPRLRGVQIGGSMDIVSTSAPPTAADLQQIAALLQSRPDYGEHAACGVTARPCPDCRRTAALECTDPDTCCDSMLCRVCAAGVRCHLWRGAHLRHVRRLHRAIERYPAIGNLSADQEALAAWWRETNRAIYGTIKRAIEKWLARELPAVVKALVEGRR